MKSKTTKQKYSKKLPGVVPSNITISSEKPCTEFKTTRPNCSTCKKSFKDLRSLSTHLNQIHNSKQQICPYCGKFYKQPQLCTHINNVHSDQLNLGKFICDFCEKIFKSRTEITRHLKRWHLIRECQDCKRKFYSYPTWLLHQNSVHQPEKKFKCEMCNKTFEAKKYLNQHQKVHQKDGYPCPLCPDKGFSFSTTLKIHILHIHPDVELPPPGTKLKNFDWSKYLKQYY